MAVEPVVDRLIPELFARNHFCVVYHSIELAYDVVNNINLLGLVQGLPNTYFISLH